MIALVADRFDGEAGNDVGRAGHIWINVSHDVCLLQPGESAPASTLRTEELQIKKERASHEDCPLGVGSCREVRRETCLTNDT